MYGQTDGKGQMAVWVGEWKTGELMDEWTNRQSDGHMVKLTELLTEILTYLHSHRQIKR